MKKPIALSFFSGALGLDIGLERAGFRVVLACEADRDARRTISANRPGLRLLGDIRQYSAAQVRAAAGIGEDADIDLVAGGPPCQSYSTAGKLRGTYDPRGDLLLTFVDLALELAPRYLAIENVRGLMRDSAFERVLRMLQDDNYTVSYNLYDSAYFGSPQHRDRVIVIASREGRVPYLCPTNSNRPEDGLPAWRTLRDALGDLKDIGPHARYPKKRLKFFRMLRPGQNWKYLKNPSLAISEATRQATGGKAGFYRRLSWDRPAPTLMTNPCNFLGGCCHPDEHRPLSVEEYKRVQGFSDRWSICGSLASQYRQLGNAVPVPLSEAIGKTIIRHMRTGHSSEERPGFSYSRYRNTGDLDRRADTIEERMSDMKAFECLDQLCTELHIPPALPPECFAPVPGVTCYRCDYRRLPIEPKSVDAVITDLPWTDKWLRNFEELGAWCAEVLKPGGIFCTLYTARNLNRLFVALDKHLNYVWTCPSPMHGSNRLHTPFIHRCCTLGVVYSNGPKANIHRSPADLLPYSWREKTIYHEHQQSLPVVQYLVEHFAKEGSLVVDPCSGGWTTMEACVRTGRLFVGSDDRANCLDVAKRRFTAMRAA